MMGSQQSKASLKGLLTAAQKSQINGVFQERF